MKEGINELVPLSHKTATCIHETISNTPAGVNTVNKPDVITS